MKEYFVTCNEEIFFFFFIVSKKILVEEGSLIEFLNYILCYPLFGTSEGLACDKTPTNFSEENLGCSTSSLFVPLMGPQHVFHG